jgi:hypothetical protein
MTPEQAKLIKKWLGFYDSLLMGDLLPTSEEQRHFAKVCLGEARPETEHELAYIAYLLERRVETLQKTKKYKAAGPPDKPTPPTPRSNPTQRGKEDSKTSYLDDRRAAIEAAERWRQDFEQRSKSSPPPGGTKKQDAFEKRYVDEPLGSREDFKKDSGRNWSQSRSPK